MADDQAPLPSIVVPSLNSLLSSPLPSSSRSLFGGGLTSSARPPTFSFTGFVAAPSTTTQVASSAMAESESSTTPEATTRRRSARLQHQTGSPPAAAGVSKPAAKSSDRSSRKRKAETQPSRRKKTPRKTSAKKDPPGASMKPPPNAKDDANYETTAAATTAGDEEKEEPQEETCSCCVCMSIPNAKDLSKINGCDHTFCFDCIAKWADRENTCPLCKIRFTKITRVNKTKRRRGAAPNSKSVRSRDQRSDLVSGAALEAMLHSIAATNRSSASQAGQTRLRSIFMSSFPMATRNNQARPAGRRTALFMEENLLESDDESSEGLATSLGLPDFNELMRQTMSTARSTREPRHQPGPFAATLGATGGLSSPPGFSLGPAPLFSLFSHHQPPMPLHAAAAAPPSRSYAVNANDSNAGRAAENPLEIDDSSEDEVEVVEVS